MGPVWDDFFIWLGESLSFFFEKNTRGPGSTKLWGRNTWGTCTYTVYRIYIYTSYISCFFRTIFLRNEICEFLHQWQKTGLIDQKGVNILTSQRLQPPNLGCFSLCFFSRIFSQEFRPWDSIWDFPRYSRRGSGAQDIVCLLGENSLVVFFLWGASEDWKFGYYPIFFCQWQRDEEMRPPQWFL